MEESENLVKWLYNSPGGNYLGIQNLRKDFMMLEILLPEMCTRSINKYILNSVIPALALAAFSLTMNKQIAENERNFRVKSHGLPLFLR